jgi:hypothetical protein
MFYTVSEKWSYNHDNDFRVLIHFKLDEMEKNGQFIINTLNNDRSVYQKDGSPVKIFTSLEAANDYIDWIKTYHTPTSMTIDSFPNEQDLNSFLKSIMSLENNVESGPTNEDHINYANKHNLQVDISKYIDY